MPTSKKPSSGLVPEAAPGGYPLLSASSLSVAMPTSKNPSSGLVREAALGGCPLLSALSLSGAMPTSKKPSGLVPKELLGGYPSLSASSLSGAMPTSKKPSGLLPKEVLGGCLYYICAPSASWLGLWASLLRFFIFLWQIKMNKTRLIMADSAIRAQIKPGVLLESV